MTKQDPLLQSFQLKHLLLKNRIISTSHEPAYSEDGLPGLRYQLYHEEKAKGGISLTMFGGGTLVSPDTPAAYGNLYAGNNQIVPYFRELARRVHSHGAATMCQITHLGRRTSNYQGDWLPIIAPSSVRERAHRAFPKTMEDWDIKRTVKAYGAAASRCMEGDLDGIEIEAYGHLLDSFWTPTVNRRTDEYGGSLRNRVRFPLEVLEEVRRCVGDDFIVGVRMSFDENLDAGIQFDEGLRIGEILANTGMIDFISVIRGHVDSNAGLSDVIPNMGTPSAPYLSFCGEVKKNFDLPIMHAARINDVATARYAIEEGILDLVGMTRAHFADPHIVAKVERGEEDQIRPCVGAGYCIVRLLEASHIHGGQVNLAAKVKRRREILGITDWLFDQCQRRKIEMHFNCYADTNMVMESSPDVVLIATGGTPNLGFLSLGQNLVVSSWDVLSGSVPVKDTVLLYDDNGQHAGVSCAEFIAENGGELEYLSPEMLIAPDIGGTNHPAYLRSFYNNDVTISLNQQLIAVAREDDGLAATIFNEYTGNSRETRIQQVVIDHGTIPADDLYFDLKRKSINQGEVDQTSLLSGQPQHVKNNPDGQYQLFRLGDAVTSRNIHAAIYDALRLCITI